MTNRLRKPRGSTRLNAEGAGRCTRNVHADRGFFHQCTRRAVVTRDGKGYCRQHDPVAIKAKSDAWHAAYDAKEKADDATERAARKLARRLGIAAGRQQPLGTPHYVVAHRLKHSGYAHALLLEFAEVEYLIDRLKE